MSAKLVVLAGPRCGETFVVDAPALTLGRDPGSQLNIPDHLMSRRHCTLEMNAGCFTLRDVGSSNGTYVNGIPVRERLLAHGDRIRAGDSVLLFLHQAEPDREGTPLDPTGPAFDELTERVPRPAADESRSGDLDSEGAIVAEVLSGRVALQAHDMVGDSAPMRAVYERICKAAPSDCTVLICGETGTGKELAARAIHQNSPRARHPFVAVNCRVLTESLLER